MKNISDHITYKEATYSITAIRHGIDNKPGSVELENMQLVAEKIFEPMRAFFSILFGVDVPIDVTSFFRIMEVNLLVGSSDRSDHPKGKAIDAKAFKNTPITNADIFYYIYENLDFDQLLWEFGTDEQPAWVHFSFRKTKNRKQVKRARTRQDPRDPKKMKGYIKIWEPPVREDLAYKIKLRENAKLREEANAIANQPVQHFIEKGDGTKDEIFVYPINELKILEKKRRDRLADAAHARAVTGNNGCAGIILLLISAITLLWNYH